MQLSTLFVTVLATAVIATPSKRGNYPNGGGDGTPYVACSGTYPDAQCCSTDVLGVADLDCATVSETPTSAASFEEICAAGGQRARCCLLPVLGQDVLCETPVGV
ncbi:cerato-ulmin [Hypoxylon sp. FL1150]|nr:cerato-ulmin [Hypoxylon sp. FL1150]